MLTRSEITSSAQNHGTIRDTFDTKKLNDWFNDLDFEVYRLKTRVNANDAIKSVIVVSGDSFPTDFQDINASQLGFFENGEKLSRVSPQETSKKGYFVLNGELNFVNTSGTITLYYSPKIERKTSYVGADETQIPEESKQMGVEYIRMRYFRDIRQYEDEATSQDEYERQKRIFVRNFSSDSEIPNIPYF